MQFSANHEEMEFTEQLTCFHKPIAVNSKSITSVTLKKRNDTMRNSAKPLFFFFSNQNDLLVKQTPIPVLFLISKAIIHHFKSQREPTETKTKEIV